MKEIIKNGASVFVKLIIVNIMCFFVVISFSVLTTAAFTKNIGYKATGTTSESSEAKELYTYYYDQGDDTKKADYESQGYTVTETKIRSDITRTGKAVFIGVSQFFCFLILVSFIYPNVWHIGTKDSNLVRFKHKTEDKAKGFKIGAVAAVVPVLFWAFILVAKFGVAPSFPTVLYKFLNSYYYGFIELILDKTASAGGLSVLQLILMFVLLLLIPVISGVSYMLGYNNFSLSEKLIYKKK